MKDIDMTQPGRRLIYTSDFFAYKGLVHTNTAGDCDNSRLDSLVKRTDSTFADKPFIYSHMDFPSSLPIPDPYSGKAEVVIDLSNPENRLSEDVYKNCGLVPKNAVIKYCEDILLLFEFESREDMAERIAKYGVGTPVLPLDVAGELTTILFFDQEEIPEIDAFAYVLVGFNDKSLPKDAKKLLESSSRPQRTI